MKKAICILSVLAILLCAWLVLLWLPALTHEGKPQSETRYGLSEGLQLVEQTFAGKEKRYVVEDGEGNVVFDVPRAAASSTHASAAAGSAFANSNQGVMAT